MRSSFVLLGGLAAALSLAGCATTAARAVTAEPAAPRTIAVSDVQPSRRDVAKKVLPSSVRVFLDDEGKPMKGASGVVVGNKVSAGGSASYIVTNAHIMDTAGMKSPSLRVVVEQNGESMEYGADLVAAGSVPDMDLALVQLSGVVLPPAELADDNDVQLGDDVLVVAAPFGHALTISGGMLSQIEWDQNAKTPKSVKTDAAVGYGASGGGVFSLETGKLLAVVEGYRTAKVGFNMQDQDFTFDLPVPGETFAAPVSKVRRFLTDKGFSALIAQSHARAER